MSQNKDAIDVEIIENLTNIDDKKALEVFGIV